MSALVLAFVIIGVLCSLAAAAQIGHTRVNLIGAALAFYGLAALVTVWP